MIGIKKVQVVPLDENYAKVIDSFNTQDDKTKNAPSINAVEGKLEELHDDINSDIIDTNNNVTALSNSAMLKDKFAVLYGYITMPEANASLTQGNTTISLPSGFTMHNSAVISLMGWRTSLSTPYYTTTMQDTAQAQALGVNNLSCRLGETDITVWASKTATSQASYTVRVRIVLMKTDFDDISDYELGDINMDGEVTQDDYTLLQNYLNGSGSLTGKQFKLADMNEDGILNSGDLLLLQQKINS